MNKENLDALLEDKDLSLPLEMAFSDDHTKNWNEYFYSIDFGVANATPEMIYLTSNENLSEFFKNNKVKSHNKKVLTVGSSFDQGLNAILFGSRDVTVIDLNIYTKYFADLKMSAIKNLTFDEFHQFFRFFEKRATDGFPFFEEFKLYQKLSHSLPKDSQLFWDVLMLGGIERTIEQIFHEKVVMAKSLFYESENEYNKLKSILKNEDIKLNFIHSEFFDFCKKTSGKFDLIMLSNILDYYNSDYEFNETPYAEEFENEFFYGVKELYDTRLADNGIMQIFTSSILDNDKESLDRVTNKFKNILNNNKITKIENSGMICSELQGTAYSSYIVQKQSEPELQK